MKNLYINTTKTKLNYLIVILAILLGMNTKVNAQVKKAFTQRTSQYTPIKKIYNVKGDFTMLGNTCLTPQNYGPNTNNNGQFMTYVDVDGDPNTFNSSSSTLVMSTENGAVPSCSKIVYAGLYWTGKSSSNNTFNVTKQVPNGTQTINNNLNVIHNENITNTNYTLSVTRGGANGNRNPIYTFSGNGSTYAFSFFNSSATNRVTLSVNGGPSVNIPVTVNGAGTIATLNTAFNIVDGNVTLKIVRLIRSSSTNLSTGDTQDSSNADVNISGTIQAFTNLTKTFNKRVVSLKGPAATGYTQITASANDIYYPSGTDDDIYSAYAEITDYVRTNGIGQYTLADMALLEGNVGGTGYSGGWGMIVIYENSKMKWRDITIFDGYAYVVSSNTSGHDLPVSGFNTVQTGDVGMKLGVMASEGDISFTGDYFRIRNLNSTNYTSLSHSSNSTSNFFNSSINAGGTRNPNLSNNTGIDIALIDVPNSGNTIIGNGQTSTNFRYGTSGDTYSIFAIAMSVDAYVPEVEGIITTTTINGSPATQPYNILPNQEAGFSVDIKNIGTETINNYKLIIPIPYNASYVPGSAVGTIFNPQTTPTPNNISFNPSLGVTGSLVWDFGTLVLPPNPNTILAKLTFRLTATSNCSILNNASCTDLIAVNGYSTGISGITSVNLNNTELIQGYAANGSCIGEPIPAPIYLTIDGSSYVSQNCSGDNILRNFTYCSENTTVGTSEIASNFPPGSLFYNEFPVTINAIQYSDSNPIPLIAGSTVTYYAVPAGGGNGCNFPFTISKCPSIIAEDDTLSGGNGTTGNPNVGNVLSDNGNGIDTINNNQATTSQVTISIVTPATPIGGNPVPVINTLNGQVSVPPGTPAGTYTIIYQICDINNISNCDSAIVTITVDAPIIDAVDDNGASIIGASGGQTVANVLVNDTLNGNQATLSNVILTQVSTTNPNVTLDPATGAVNVAPGTTAGNYIVTYQICEILNPTNCDTAIVTVSVSGANINAVDDNGTPIVGASGGQTVANVLVNDTLNGNQATLSNVILTQVSTTNPNVTLDPATGAVNVAPGTAAGNYIVTYQICEILNPTNCDTAIVTVSVSGANIIAVDDNGTPIVGASGGQTVANVLVNDTLNGNQATLSNVILTQVSTTNPNVTLDPATGAVNVAPGTAAGNYIVTYQICEILNPTNCDTAIVTVSVSGANINAVDDNYNNILCTATGTIGNILVNDTLNGNPATLDSVTLSILTGNNPFITINNNGDVIVSQGSSCGVHTFTYEICEIINPTNCDTATVTVNISDNNAPTWTTVIGSLDVILECGNATGLEAAQALFPIASDSCDTDVSNIVKNEGQFVASTTCANSGTYTNTWTVTDACGNISDSFVQTIRIQDTTAPVIATLPATSTISCPAAPEFAQATATDECGSAFELTFEDATTNGTCAGSYSVTRTWTATDACGNTATASQTINVQDLTAPVIAALPATSTISCPAAPEFAQATATDECGSAFELTFEDATTNGNCAGSYSVTRTWTATDACGNTATASQTINVQDVTAPVIAALPATSTISCPAAPEFAQATATDECGSAFELTFEDATTNGNCAGSYSVTRTWTATDACGNTATASQTINVQDVTAPVIAALPATATISCPAAPEFAQATATDECGSAFELTFEDATTNGNCAGSYSVTRTWTATDACGNTATASQTINVQDVTAPVIAALPATATISCPAAPEFTQATATDECGSAFELTFEDATTNGNCAGSYSVTRTWTATDACGNTATASQTINVQDVTAPLIAALPATSTISCPAAPEFAQATATDECGSAFELTFEDATTNGNCAGSYSVTRTWTATDACGNIATASQTINVQDVTAPVINSQASNIVVACDGNGNELALSNWLTNNGGATATDECSLVTWSNNFSVISGDCSAAVTVLFTATDACGNTASTSATFTINDIQTPVTPNAPADVTVACAAEVPANTSLTATDNCSGEISAQGVDVVTQGNCPNSFSVIRTWTFTDACGNSSSVAQNITVSDTIAPVAPEAPADVTVACAADVPANTSLTATDNCSGEISAQGVDVVTQGNCPNSFSVIRTWTFTDACGNSSSVAQNITVSDTIAPVAPEAPADVTVACAADVPANTSLTATDNCSGEISAQGVDAVTQGNCPNSFSVIRTWTFTDACGNSSSVSQNITVSDTIDPVAPEAPADVTVACAADVPANTSLTATDNCLGEISAQGVDVVTQGNCPNSFSVIRTWTFTDACGNSSSVSQNITVSDTIDPVAPEAPADVTVACAADVPANTSLTATDNCLGEISAQGVDVVTQGNCPNSFSVIRTWTFTDACGNSSSVAQNITVSDTIAPVAPEAPADVTVACAADVPANTSLTATDNCLGEISAQGVDAVTQGNCPNSFSVIRTWTFTDACGNSSSVSQNITVSDTIDPVAPEAPADVTVACAADVPANTSLTATDNCLGEISAQGVDVVTQGNCPNSFSVIRTWTFTDACGNSSSVAQNITVSDTIAPVAPEAPADVTVACAADVPANTSLTATDNCSGEISAQGVDVVTQGNCPNSFSVIRTWTFTDACGNSSSVAQNITVSDTIAPVAPEAPADVTVACAADVPANTSLTATDNCSGEISAQGVDVVTQGNCPNSFSVIRTWTFTDACGNSSSVAQNITVSDTIAPVAPEAPADVTVACAADVPANTSLTATDNCSGEISAQGVDVVTQGNCPNSFSVIRTWTFTDACGNSSSVSQNITVSDTIAPVAPEAPADVTVACAADVPANTSLSATDNCSGEISAQGVDVVTQGNCPNSFSVIRTWTFTDACGNSSSVAQNITVSDTIAPVAPEAPADVTVSCVGEVPAMISLTAADNCGEFITVEGVDNFVQGDCPNSFSVTRTWTFTDACGNTSSVSQNISIFDETAPLAQQAPANLTVACAGDVPATISLTAFDNCGESITVQGVDTITQGNCLNTFTVTRTWTFTDACENTTVETQIITVSDTINPTFNEVAPANTTASCDNIPTAAVLTANDNCGTATVTMAENITQGNCPSNYLITRTWTATDACGNTSVQTQTIGVSDTVGPVLASELQVKIDVNCSQIPDAPTLTFTDNCSTVGTPVFTETQSEPVNGTYTITRSWVVSDACGNVSQTYYQYVFVDQIAEVIDLGELGLNNFDNVNTPLDPLLPVGVTGGTWTNVNSVGGFDPLNNTFNPFGIEIGDYLFTYTVNNGPCPTTYNLLIRIGGVGPCDAIIIHNAFTPNGDAFNQYFNIENIEDIACYPTNNVQIYNRWGVLVYETKNYDNNTRRFEGISEGRVTVSKSEELPTGTYFYIIEWTTSEGTKVTKDGYLYLTR